ncbi:hypothetical protein D9M71_681670 [compost metagenome]
MARQDDAQQGHQKHFHHPFHQVTEGQHVAHHDAGGHFAVVQRRGIAMHGLIGFQVLVADYGLHPMLGGHRGAAAGADFGLTQAETRGEHREKAVSLDHLRPHVRQGDQGQGQVIVG